MCESPQIQPAIGDAGARHILLSLLLNQLGRIAAVRGGLRQALGHFRKSALQLRQQFAPQPDPAVPLVLVLRVLYPADSMLAGVVPQQAARQSQQRSPQLRPAQGPQWGHARQALDAATPQQPVEHGFGLIVAVVGHRTVVAFAQQLGQRLIAGAPGRRLRPLTLRTAVDRQTLEFDAPAARLFAATPGPEHRCGLQLVVHVHGLERRRPGTRQAVQQYRGI